MALMPTWGRLSDRVGRRPVLLIWTLGAAAAVVPAQALLGDSAVRLGLALALRGRAVSRGPGRQDLRRCPPRRIYRRRRKLRRRRHRADACLPRAGGALRCAAAARALDGPRRSGHPRTPQGSRRSRRTVTWGGGPGADRVGRPVARSRLRPSAERDPRSRSRRGAQPQRPWGGAGHCGCPRGRAGRRRARPDQAPRPPSAPRGVRHPPAGVREPGAPVGPRRGRRAPGVSTTQGRRRHRSPLRPLAIIDHGA